MPKFEIKIRGMNDIGGDSELDWCRRNVEENLQRFRSEYLSRSIAHFGKQSFYNAILDDMIPCPTPAHTDTERLDWVEKHGASASDGVWKVPGKTWRECIDIAIHASERTSRA